MSKRLFMTLKQWMALGLMTAAAPFSAAAELALEVEIPRLQVAEYHRPYVAIWIETDKGAHQQNLALWFDHDMDDNEGTKWLKDLRLWWRRSGREESLPVDGYAGATRPVGTHRLTFSDQQAPLNALPPGKYKLVVEAAREVGGREMIRLPFEWPVSTSQETSAEGEHELGHIELNLNP